MLPGDTHTPQIDDRDVVQAMTVYDTLNAAEQRNVFRTVYRAVAAYRRTGNAGHMTRLAESITGMVVLETNQPGVREMIRNAAKTVREAGGVVDAGETIRRLTERQT